MTRNVIFRYLFPAVLAGITIFHGSSATEVLAQDQVVIELFGRSIHSYYRGEYQSALDNLDLAIEQGSVDPRYYYFRGLAKFALDQKSEADADFEKGASLELTATRSYPIGQSLERVQGAARLKLEEHRQNVRVKQYLKKKAWEQARYESLKQAEEEVLRKRVEKSAANLVVQPGTSDPTDPFKNADTTVREPMPIEGVTPTSNTQPATNDPFGGTPKPAGTDPFGGSPTPMPATPAADPFGGSPAPAATDPFGGSPTPMPATPTADPFGASAAPPTEQPAGATNPVTAALSAITRAFVPQVSVPGLPSRESSIEITSFDEPVELAPTENSDPFGAAPMPATPAPADSDPFGATPAPADSDPFGATPAPA
ncbi:MAG: hypothetical protein ACKVH8_24340, partial [Pirellulales bacterium]